MGWLPSASWSFYHRHGDGVPDQDKTPENRKWKKKKKKQEELEVQEDTSELNQHK